MGSSAGEVKRLPNSDEYSPEPGESFMKDPRRSWNPWVGYNYLRQSKIVTVEPVIFLYMFATYLVYYLNQQYYFNQFALEKFINASDRDLVQVNGSACINITDVDEYTGMNDTYKWVQSRSNALSLYTSLANRILSIISTLILGPLSDRYGRRVVIIVVAIGSILQGAVSLCVILLNLNLYLFILGSALAGICGDMASLLMASFAYISDFSSRKWRTVRIGVAESMIFCAGMISSGAGGFWFAKLNCHLAYPFVLFVLCNFALILYTILFLPESLTSEERRIKSKGKPRGIFALLAGFKIVFCQISKYMASVWILWVALVPMFIMAMVMGSATSIGVYFYKALHWTSTRIGLNISTAMGSHLLVLLAVLPILTALGFPDPLLSLIGLLFNMFMNLFLGLSHKTYQVFLISVIQGMDAMMIPPLRGLMSKLVSVEDQGALFSIVASTESLGTLLSGIAFPIILPATIEHNMNPGIAYMVMAAVGLIALPFICILLVSWIMGKCRTKAMALAKDDDPRSPLLGPSLTKVQQDCSPQLED